MDTDLQHLPGSGGQIVRTISEKFPFVRVFVANPGDLLLVASHHDLSASDLDRAEALWQSNTAMRDSLASVGIGSLNELLLREVWSPEYIRENFRQYEVQSMDHPKLHYLAGKHFFFGNHVKLYSLLTAKTAAYWPSYALAKRFAHWPSHCFEEPVLDKAIAGLKHDSLLEALNPLAEAAALKAVANPECSAGLSFTGTYNDATRALGRLIAGTSTDEEDWELAGIKEESPRQRAADLIGVVLRNRNWIATYPVDGLVAYLEHGVQDGAAPEERNWFLLQKARIITSDGAPIKEVRDLLARAERDSEGRIRLEAKDSALLEEVEGYDR